MTLLQNFTVFIPRKWPKKKTGGFYSIMKDEFAIVIVIDKIYYIIFYLLSFSAYAIIR